MVSISPSNVKPLGGSFFRRPTLEIAPDLLGCALYVNNRGAIVGGRIVEVEAYIGEEDPACHACRGRTKRNAIMYGPPGRAYVYFTYGHHWMLNVVTEQVDRPAAVLIRGIEPTHGISFMRRRREQVDERNLTNGPGKLTSALGINGDDNGAVLAGPRITLTRIRAGAFETATSGRVGVSDGSETPWRFYVAGNPWVSAYRRGARATRSQ